MYPTYTDLNIKNYSLVDGYYTLGFIKQHRPDIDVILDSEIGPHYHPAQVDQRIQQGLKQNKKVALFVWDEDFVARPGADVIDILNSYKHDNVYVVTQMDSECQKFYTFQHGISCKLIELPWWLLNDCLCYYSICQHMPVQALDNSKQFACMVARNDWHKTQLVLSLINKGYGASGLLSFQDYPEELDPDQQALIEKHCVVSLFPNYTQQLARQGKLRQSSHYMKKSSIWDSDAGVWISNNANNFRLIEQKIAGIPLVINPESTVGIFLNTEKSLWPMLLGKLFMIYSRPGIMASVQRFYNFDLSKSINLEFDSIPGYTKADHLLRLECMLDQNQYLIRHSRDVYQSVAKEIETARWTVGANLYQYFCQQLDLIK